MKSRRMVLWSAALLTLACGLAAAPLLSSASAALMLLGPVYNWTDGAGNSNWNSEDNWTGPSGYPNAGGDAADFPDNSGTTWEVDVTTTETFGQLKINESVDFDGGGGGPTLTASTLVIDGTSRAITVTFYDGMELVANP